MFPLIGVCDLDFCTPQQNGDGHVDTPEKKLAIVQGIKEAIEKSMEAAATRLSSLSGSTEGVGSTPRKTSLSGSTDATSTRKASLTGSTEVVGRTRKISESAARIMAKVRIHVIYW